MMPMPKPGDPILVRHHDLDAWRTGTFVGFDTVSTSCRLVIAMLPDQRESTFARCKLIRTETVL